MRDEEALQKIRTSVHSPGAIRYVEINSEVFGSVFCNIETFFTGEMYIK